MKTEMSEMRAGGPAMISLKDGAAYLCQAIAPRKSDLPGHYIFRCGKCGKGRLRLGPAATSARCRVCHSLIFELHTDPASIYPLQPVQFPLLIQPGAPPAPWHPPIESATIYAIPTESPAIYDFNSVP